MHGEADMIRAARTAFVAGAPPSSMTAPLDEDLELMQRVGRGDVAAFRVMSERYLDRIVRFAARVVGHGGDAEDVAQETFLRLWTEAARFEPRAGAKPSTWLYRIAHNLCVDRLRRRKPNDVAALEEQTSRERPSGDYERKETAERVAEAIAALPERQRVAITLVHYEGLGNAEAAKVMEVGVEALESLLSRGRRALRDALKELGV